ncbi:MAG: hypothetical protein QF473_08670 [Planctomycetota bacterium]|nr:hypothetical protein [Planctomycetota bacterium]
MKILFDPNFVEETILLAVDLREQNNDLAFVRDYYRQRDPLYSIPAGRKRDQAFIEMHRRMFDREGLGKPLLDGLSEFPQLGSRARSFHVRAAVTTKEEGADLSHPRGKPDQFSIVFKVKPKTWLSGETFLYFCREELYHVADMLDPAFGYLKELPPVSGTAAAANLLRDRYRVVWSLTIDGRLSRRRLLPEESKERRLFEFEKVFPRMGGDERLRSFEAFWSDPSPTHQKIVDFCQAAMKHSLGPNPGASCPLCGFPTFDWSHTISAEIIEAVKVDFPDWEPSYSLCGQCLELYRQRKTSAVFAPLVV